MIYLPGAERWRVVKGAPDYLVSDHGRVQRITPGAGTRARPLKASPGKDGTLRVNLRVPVGPKARRRKTVTRYVHHLVLEAFDRPPERGEIGAHADGDLSNNVLANLSWRRPEPVRNARLTADQVAAIRASGGTQADLAAEYGVNRATIGLIRRGKTWKATG